MPKQNKRMDVVKVVEADTTPANVNSIKSTGMIPTEAELAEWRARLNGAWFTGELSRMVHEQAVAAAAVIPHGNTTPALGQLAG